MVRTIGREGTDRMEALGDGVFAIPLLIAPLQVLWIRYYRRVTADADERDGERREGEEDGRRATDTRCCARCSRYLLGTCVPTDRRRWQRLPRPRARLLTQPESPVSTNVR
ncbi:hypothetical protein [Halopiger aswanensis]|uniref:Uncharacterized protein n=1 Tax=Halopiger aswanensis TaxID=148449 RepID=A0A3R7I0C2_9EURY|nr:hypothetical protein [Halopiger aswanensis]RKD98367.1 hypothetical protein ATJ93_1374 [Halopiger aswanensis]